MVRGKVGEERERDNEIVGEGEGVEGMVMAGKCGKGINEGEREGARGVLEVEEAGGRERAEGEKICRVAFWNVAGLRNKGRDFWGELKDWDIMFMCETWLNERRWEKIRGYLPKGFKWDVQKRRNKRGRAMGGMVVGIKRGIEVERRRG